MYLQAIKEIFSVHWKPGWGSINPEEALYVQSLIEEHKPKTFIEVGMASGISGGLISQMLDENNGELFISIDHDNTFFGDETKENGFLIEQIYKGGAIDVRKEPFTTTLDLPRLGQYYDMAFVDANHQHPWPIIDTLCLYPFMTGDKIVIHHDLCLFRNQEIVYGIGPKYLFDQFPESHKDVSEANKGNIFSISLDIDGDRIEQIAANAFSLPWSLRTPLQENTITKIREILNNYYSGTLLNSFDNCVNKFNDIDRFRTGV